MGFDSGRHFQRSRRRRHARRVGNRVGGLTPFNARRQYPVAMRADGENSFGAERGVIGDGRSHGTCGLPCGDGVNGTFEQRGEMGRCERARHRAARTGAVNGRTNDREQIGSEPSRPDRQLTLCASDQADKRVTRSNSRRSFDTT